jgi:flavin-dependent dehydrogenase
MNFDAIIVGGGPAGSTLGGMLLKYRPNSRILILERAHFPRFHVGETLVTELNRTLQELGVYEQLEASGFIRKMGATFIWGDSDEAWHMLFGDFDRIEHVDTGHGTVQTTWSWHVERSRYDDVLLRHAESMGATVQQGVGVTDLIHDDQGRVTGVHTDQGETHTARWVVDATGQQGLAGSLADREMDPVLQNIAYGTYWKGAHLLEDWNGNLSASRAFIVAHPQGWSWVFPVRKDLVSVGLVTSLEAHRNRRDQDPEAFVQQAIAESPHLSRILEGAELCEGPQNSRVRISTDFSYTSRSIVQPGLIRLGDAAGFVDPILSVGCFLGQSFARFLAYALNTVLSSDGGVDEDRALGAYEHQVRDTLASFRELTYFFYRFNQSPDDWWAHARALVASTAMPSAASDREAFLAFATGFAAHGSVWREPGAFFGQDFFVDLYTRFVPAASMQTSATSPLGLQDVIALRAEPTLTASAVPLEGEGRLAPSTRVEVGVGEPGESRRIRRMQVPVAMGELFPLIDGEATLTQIGDTFVAKNDIDPSHRASLNRYILWIARSLVDRDLATRIPPRAVLP